ncbi:hypothetical protein C8R45DRAFT_1157901 [Mycena sanguinolenta]|nr:hypothetical protein C8R45DRAFT_1157901 [Mycena sanguinolenta]
MLAHALVSSLVVHAFAFLAFLVVPVAAHLLANDSCPLRTLPSFSQPMTEHGLTTSYTFRFALALSDALLAYHPLRRIPAEILGEIFLCSLPPRCALNVEDSPWVLTHVCRSWRAVAVSKSSLWTQIYVNFANRKKYSLDLARRQIDRARTLKIRFSGSEEHDSGPQIDMLQLLLERSAIWQDLRLVSIAAFVPLLTDRSGRFPLLQRAWVQWDGPASQEGVESVDFFRMAASLTEITIYCEHRFLSTSLPIHARITRYDLDAPWATHYELLKSLPYLREPIHLAHLQGIYVSRAECLDYIRAPALERIGIQSRKSIEICSHLDSFVTRSSCVLRRLCLSGLPDVQRTDQILQQFPSITELAVRILDRKSKDKAAEYNLLSTYLTRFATLDSNTTFPHISKLDFACQNVDVIPYPLYLDMLDSRWNALGYALNAAELLLPQALVYPDPESVARMETLCQAGLQVHFLSGEAALKRTRQWLHIATWP